MALCLGRVRQGHVVNCTAADGLLLAACDLTRASPCRITVLTQINHWYPTRNAC
jgi:hypothetical protein